jgi:hypothetical protein
MHDFIKEDDHLTGFFLLNARRETETVFKKYRYQGDKTSFYELSFLVT